MQRARWDVCAQFSSGLLANTELAQQTFLENGLDISSSIKYTVNRDFARLDRTEYPVGFVMQFSKFDNSNIE